MLQALLRYLPVLVLPLALAACGGGSGGSPPGLTVTTIGGLRVDHVLTFTETEFAIRPNRIVVDRFGLYGIRAVNRGKQAHGLMLEGPGIKKQTGEIPPGDSKSFVATFTRKGTYHVFSPIGGDRKQGMNAIIQVVR